MKKTKVVAGFPGTGKSYMFKNNTDNLVLLDSDSSKFSWIDKGVRNPIFPQNYIEHIKENLGIADVIFVSTHDTVIKALQENGIPFILVYPSKELKETYLNNYKQRGNDDNFIEFIRNNWDNFITNMMKTECQQRIELKEGQYIKDIVGGIFSEAILNSILEETDMTDYSNTTFLGGTCNGSTWREELISRLNYKVEFFNPVVDDWTPECQAREDKAREDAKYVLFVITSQMTGVFSIAEVVDCSNKRSESTLFCVISDGFDKAQAKSLKAVSNMVKRNGAKVFNTIEEIADFLNSAYK